MKKGNNVFVYGTLQSPAVRKQIIKRTIATQPDSLIGFSRGHIRVNGNTYYVAEPDPLGHIDGKLITNLSNSDLALLDNYETDAYERRLLKLASGTRAWVYCQASN